MSANVLMEDRPTEVASVDWNDEYRVEVTLLDGAQELSIEQAEQLSVWLLSSAQGAREALGKHLADNRARMVGLSAQSGAEGVL